ncbi:MAG: helix-turn-helix domain-containing protein [Planctomycetia bacterium]|jgi:transcriptional regulator with XRE-family HTH domain
MPASVNLADLGRRVRAARMARRLTLEEVVSRADFTVSWLSKLENGQLAPSLEGLVKLADVLECGVDSLVEGLSVPPQYVVVKSGTGRIDPAPKDRKQSIVVEHLADQWRNRSMNPVILHISGNGNRGNPDNHDGERFLMVLEGELKLEYGNDLLLLSEGDSIYIYAAIPHTLMPAGRGPVRVLSVAYEPIGARPSNALGNQKILLDGHDGNHSGNHDSGRRGRAARRKR